MSDLERKVDLLIALALADNEGACVALKESLMSVCHRAKKCVPVSEEDVIEDVLTEMGVPCHLKGYGYTVIVVKELLNRSSMLISKEMYPYVAKVVGGPCSASRVERDIRHAVECVWDRGDMSVLNQYFGNTVSRVAGKPTNGHFIYKVAQEVRRRMAFIREEELYAVD